MNMEGTEALSACCLEISGVESARTENTKSGLECENKNYE